MGGYFIFQERFVLQHDLLLLVKFLYFLGQGLLFLFMFMHLNYELVEIMSIWNENIFFSHIVPLHGLLPSNEGIIRIRSMHKYCFTWTFLSIMPSFKSITLHAKAQLDYFNVLRRHITKCNFAHTKGKCFKIYKIQHQQIGNFIDFDIWGKKNQE